MNPNHTVKQVTPQYLRPGKTLVMGVLNVTPNSFSDGGKWLDTDAAVAHGQELLAAGADLIDVGGESTAPGNDPVSPQEETARVVPVIEALAANGALISCDTRHAETARAAAAAGALIINDVSGGLTDPDMFDTVAALQAQHPQLSYICQHWRGHLKDANRMAIYDNPHREVLQEVQERVAVMRQRGDIDLGRVILDPGFGFSKQGDQDWNILANLEAFLAQGFPVLVGVSRKRFLAGFETSIPGRHPRDEVTTLLSLYCALKGVWAVRVHQVETIAMGIRALRKMSECREFPVQN
ncbi:dihydropteroate synthase [Mobiluncus mulieris]|uniref:Dihydropteroate synthase n=1 Tax=Mobiluncus mulieris TaxID=2052 RepID=A0A7Y0URV2_9ACTO|nr:dihydropteroate synthase [Mobiluncus mulieris]NMX02581.1 dihydropteroate synthase [Mobiluncus mulieris]NMX11239.1 dihydropteroate synthase [Mobiluncus mulieris]